MNIQNINIPYMNDFINSSLYQEKLIHYSKLLISLGIIFLILTMIMKNLLNQLMGKLNTEMQKYIIKNEQREAEIFQKNDLILKEKREKAKNTHVVYCPYCGSDNMLTEKIGTCKYCRRKIEYKEQERI